MQTLEGHVRYITYDILPVAKIVCVDAHEHETDEEWSITSTVIGLVKGLGRYLELISHRSRDDHDRKILIKIVDLNFIGN